MRGKYLTKRRLEELTEMLSERDIAVLHSLHTCRHLLTGQISRLHFTANANKAAALRATNHSMTKLRDYGLVEPLERRIGGIRAGSRSFVWTLTGSGLNLLNLHNPEHTQRKRPYEPKSAFIYHTLAVSETYIRLVEICREHSLQLTKTEMEPGCWRGYTGADGKPKTLSPDLFAITETAEYEYSRFLEIDMDTESIRVVLAKCKRYADYCKSGIEQKTHGLFPLVVWLVPDQDRKERLRLAIAECREISRKQIFLVITQDEFEPLIVGGAEALPEPKGESA